MPLPGSENAVAKCNSVIFLFELCLCFSYCDLLECPLTKVYFAQSSVTDQWASAQLYCSVRCMKLLLFKNSFSPDITVTGHYSLQWIIVQFRGCIRSIHNWLWKWNKDIIVSYCLSLYSPIVQQPHAERLVRCLQVKWAFEEQHPAHVPACRHFCWQLTERSLGLTWIQCLLLQTLRCCCRGVAPVWLVSAGWPGPTYFKDRKHWVTTGGHAGCCFADRIIVFVCVS